MQTLNAYSFVCLGRGGDILSAIPYAQHLAKANEVYFYTSFTYRWLFQFFPEIKSVVWNKSYNDARIEAAKYNPLIDAQITFTGKPREHNSWQEEQWHNMGAEPQLLHSLPLKLTGKFPNKTKKIGFALRGYSAAFPQHEELWKFAEQNIPNAVWIDKNNYPNPAQLVDEIAQLDLLVAIASMPLHIAYGFPDLPVIALLPDNRTPYHYPIRRVQWIKQLTYTEIITKEGQDTILNLVKDR